MKKYHIRFQDVMNLFDQIDYFTHINDGFQMRLLKYQDKLFDENTSQRRTRKLAQSQPLNDDIVQQIISELNQN